MLGKTKAEENTKVASETKRKKTRKVKSQIKDSLVKVTVVMGEGKEPSTLEFDTSKLKPDMKDRLIPYGASTRLVGSVGGEMGQEAVNAINHAWKGLEDGTWRPRQPSEKISKRQLEENIANMPPEEQKKMKETLSRCGINL